MNRTLCTPSEHAFSRRAFLGGAFGALGGLASPAIAEIMRQKEKQVLFVWIDGGMSQLESWEPKPGTEFSGPFRSIPTSVKGVLLSELMLQRGNEMHRHSLV